jgi:exopolyphosphatase / guanosine-5'-triphosphate,3'-diphosphate pyrophosphatase
VKFGAIDIGSNAVRLLIAKVHELEDGRRAVDKLSFYRVPVRLGSDVFGEGAISDGKTKHLVKTMKAFWYLMDVHGVEWFHAYATSAMREASNVKEVVKRVKKGANIDIEPISGDQEAELIFGNFSQAVMDASNDYLYIDVGGGSTELTLIRNGERVKSKSFQLGTVRALAGRIPDGEWTAVEAFVENLQSDNRPLYAIGTGGNANRLQRLALTPRDEAIPFAHLQSVHDRLAALPLRERREKYHLRPDRADVIVPAAEIYLRIMAIAGSSHMLVPKVGLVDGMVLEIHQEWMQEQQRRRAKKDAKKKEGQ